MRNFNHSVPTENFLTKRTQKVFSKNPFNFLNGIILLLFILFSVNSFALDSYEKASFDLERINSTHTGVLDPIQIRGTVVDNESGLPLPGVSVKVQGSNVGDITDERGGFSIDADSEDILDVSFVGYDSQIIPVNGRTEINVRMVAAATGLDELVVLGYGTQRRTDLTGSISTVKGEDVTKLSSQRVDQALQGRAAGVMVWNTDNAPGGNTLIRIRGMNSVLGGNSALVVIDGLQGGDLSSINPNDVESIEVLKDASATAIYGARGANGVILVTTKSGKTGTPKINYSYDLTHGKLAKVRKLTSPVEYANLINEEHLAQDNLGVTPKPIFSDGFIDSLARFGGTDWQSLAYHAAITQNHQIGVSGGTENLNYFISGGYLDQDGIIRKTGFKRYSLRAKINADISSWLKLGANWNGVKQDAKAPVQAAQNGSIIKDALTFPPVIPVFDEDGNYSKASTDFGSPIQNNPMGTLTGTSISNGNISNNLNLFLEAEIIEGLTFRTTGNFNLYDGTNLSFFNTDTWSGNSENGSGTVVNTKGSYVNNTNQLNYSTTFDGANADDHKLQVTLVQESNHWNDWQSEINSSDFTVQELGINDLSGAGKTLASSNRTKRTLISYLGRVNYNFQDKYLLTATYRADGSSVFGKNNKWGYFPSVGVAWRAINEDFLKENRTVSELKIRGSWGNTGNQAIGAYSTLASLGLGSNYSYNGSDDGTMIGAGIDRLPNPNLKWETTEEYNVGLDLGFFKDRLTVTADYYKKMTRDLLLSEDVPGYVGITSKINNVGSMRNKGFELSVSGRPVTGVFNWQSTVNLSRNKTTVMDLGTTDRLGFVGAGGGYGVNTPLIWLIPGRPFGEMYGWKYMGLWRADQVEEAKEYGALPGEPRYFDKNDDKIINIEDTTIIGHALPKFIFGWSNEFSYKNFDLSFLVEGRWGNKIFNVENIMLVNMNRSREVLDRWSEDNQNSDIPPIRKGTLVEMLTEDYPPSALQFPATAPNMNTRWIEDGSYARLKSLMLTYHLPQSFLNTIKFTDASVSLSANNLITITNYSGYDPEVSSFTSNDAQLGTDYGNYPPQRSFSLKVNITF